MDPREPTRISKKNIIIPITIIIIFVVGFAYAEWLPESNSPIQTIHDHSHNHSIIPYYYLQDVNLLVNSYEKNVESVEDFYIWSENRKNDNIKHYEIHSNFTKPTLISHESYSGYVVIKYKMPSELDKEEIIFYELKPIRTYIVTPDQEKFPTVILFPGSGHQGARDLVGIPSEISNYYYQDEMAIKLVKSGFLVFVPENRSYGERQIDMGIACSQSDKHTTERDRAILCSADVLRNQLDMAGIDIQDLMIKDHLTLFNYISSLNYVDKIGTGGLSLGTTFAEMMAVINYEKVNAVALASGVGSVYHSPPNHNKVGSDRLLDIDWNDLSASLAPTPLYISYGSQEEDLFGWEVKTNHTANKIQGAYDLLGSDNFTYVVHDGGHEYDPETLIEFFSNHLN